MSSKEHPPAQVPTDTKYGGIGPTNTDFKDPATAGATPASRVQSGNEVWNADVGGVQSPSEGGEVAGAGGFWKLRLSTELFKTKRFWITLVMG